MSRKSTIALLVTLGLLVAGGSFAAGRLTSDRAGDQIDSRPVAPPVSPSAPAPTWGAENVDNHIRSGTGPAFPDTLTGWRLADDYNDTVRAFADWVSLCGEDVCEPRYAATMNGCANQRFLLRWRTTAGQVVDFGHGTVAADIGTLMEEQLPEPAASGWAELHGCGWPLWKTHDEPNGLADITVAVQRWEPAA